MNDLAQKAFLEAVQLHNGQNRKGSQVPYVYHVLQVAEQLALWDIPRDANPDLWATAMLHDTVEDCNNNLNDIKNKYNATVSEWVGHMTFRDKHENETPNDYQTAKTNHLAEFKHKPIEAVVAKLADRFRNTKDYINSGDTRYAKKYLNRAKPLTDLAHERRTEIEQRFGTETAKRILFDFQELELELS